MLAWSAHIAFFVMISVLVVLLAGAPLAMPERSFAAPAREHQTPGGLNEQVLRLITCDGSFVELDRALDAVLKRLQAAASERSS
jgi:pyrroline-5-carboxylate reductase